MQQSMNLALQVAIAAMAAPHVASQTCSVSGGDCGVVSGTNDALCVDATMVLPLSISQCDTLTCSGSDSCSHTGLIANTDNVVCKGDAACDLLSISHVQTVKCDEGNGVCGGGSIFNIADGGKIQCGNLDDSVVNSFSCNGRDISSTNPFTLTCLGSDQESHSCGFDDGPASVVTNPGGSVFCHGGTATDGICDNLKITESVKCLICATDNSCRDVTLVDSNQGHVSFVPSGITFVKQECDVPQILDYLNQVLDGADCQSSDNNNVCDVVKAYCANKPDDTHCVREFQRQADGSYRKVTIPDVIRDVDPDSLSPSNNDNDSDNDTSLESWIVGSVVIAVFLILMMAIVWYFGRNMSWCSKKKSDSQDQQQDATNKVNDDVAEGNGTNSDSSKDQEIENV